MGYKNKSKDRSPEEYVHNIARTLMRQLGGIWCPYENGFSPVDEENYPQVLWDGYGEKVMKVLSEMSAATRGCILACGVKESSPNGGVCYYQVNPENCGMVSPLDGNEVLTYLAACVIIAAMVDLMREDLNDRRDTIEEKPKRISITVIRKTTTGQPA